MTENLIPESTPNPLFEIPEIVRRIVYFASTTRQNVARIALVNHFFSQCMGSLKREFALRFYPVAFKRSALSSWTNEDFARFLAEQAALWNAVMKPNSLKSLEVIPLPHKCVEGVIRENDVVLESDFLPTGERNVVMCGEGPRPATLKVYFSLHLVGQMEYSIGREKQAHRSVRVRGDDREVDFKLADAFKKCALGSLKFFFSSTHGFLYSINKHKDGVPLLRFALKQFKKPDYVQLQASQINFLAQGLESNDVVISTSSDQSGTCIQKHHLTYWPATQATPLQAISPSLFSTKMAYINRDNDILCVDDHKTIRRISVQNKTIAVIDLAAPSPMALAFDLEEATQVLMVSDSTMAFVFSKLVHLYNLKTDESSQWIPSPRDTHSTPKIIDCHLLEKNRLLVRVRNDCRYSASRHLTSHCIVDLEARKQSVYPVDYDHVPSNKTNPVILSERGILICGNSDCCKTVVYRYPKINLPPTTSQNSGGSDTQPLDQEEEPEPPAKKQRTD